MPFNYDANLYGKNNKVLSPGVVYEIGPSSIVISFGQKLNFVRDKSYMFIKECNNLSTELMMETLREMPKFVDKSKFVRLLFDQHAQLSEMDHHYGPYALLKLEGDQSVHGSELDRQLEAATRKLSMELKIDDLLDIDNGQALCKDEPLIPSIPLVEPLVENIPVKEQPFIWFNESLIETQREVVKFALARPDLAIIHGPPGTGKTTVLTEIAMQLIMRGQKVFIFAPSNVAVDNIFLALLQAYEKVRGQDKLKQDLTFVRTGQLARIDKQIHSYSLSAQRGSGVLTEGKQFPNINLFKKFVSSQKKDKQASGQTFFKRKLYSVEGANVVASTLTGVCLINQMILKVGFGGDSVVKLVILFSFLTEKE